MQRFVSPPRGSFIVVRSYSQPILRLGGLRSVLPKMYNFYARFIEYKCVDPIVLLDFDDIKFILQFLDRRHCSIRSGVCFNRSQGLFQPSDATIKPIKHWSSMSVRSDHKISFYIVLISHNEANHLSLCVPTLGLYPIDQQKS